jgi:predicted cupin superfamily sugar epimerase
MTLPHDAQTWIEALGLELHPEGGYYREMWRSPEAVTGLPARYGDGSRSLGTSILFLIPGGVDTRFHTLRSPETWHFHAGGGGTVHRLEVGGGLSSFPMGLDVRGGQHLQVHIPPGTPFAATVEPGQSFLLVGCTVWPGFSFEDFALCDRAALLAEWPAHAALIHRCTVAGQH